MIKRDVLWQGSLLGVFFAFDRVSKWLALQNGSIVFFNTKFAFLSDIPSSVGMFLIIVFLLLFAVWCWLELRKGIFPFYQGLVLVGALSNFCDRVFFGAVIDWIPLGQISIFNVADIGIGIGCLGLLKEFVIKKSV